MEMWRPEQAERPKAISGKNLLTALVLHLASFLLFFVYSVVHGLFESKEVITPIDLTVVVNENLDGKEDEPPPLDEPPPPPPPQPKPKPKPEPEKVKEPDPPKALEQIVTNIVKKVDKKETKKESEPKKKEEPKKEEPPKKTKKELLEERLAKMRGSAKNTKKKPEITIKGAESGDGRTDKKTLSNAEIMKLLNAGYKPGKSTQLATSEEQLGYSLIKAAFEKKWDKPAWTDTMKPMIIRVWFGPGGRVMKYHLESSSGDGNADQSIKTAASRVGSVQYLPAGFIEKYRDKGVPIRFTVTPQ